MNGLSYNVWGSLIWVALIVCIFLVWFFSHRAKHKERLMMIEKGMDPQSLLQQRNFFRFPWLKLGIVIIGLSIGLMIISILISLKALENSAVLPLAILGICGGGSMIIANRINKSNHND